MNKDKGYINFQTLQGKIRLLDLFKAYDDINYNEDCLCNNEVNNECTVYFTVYPRSKLPLYMVTYYIKGVTTSWTNSTFNLRYLSAWSDVTYSCA